MGKPSSARGRSPQPPVEKLPVEKLPQSQPLPPIQPKSKAAKNDSSYKSDGVEDNDVFLLPGSDYWTVLGLTALATVVRVFRIYRPSSVVFDEVQ